MSNEYVTNFVVWKPSLRYIATSLQVDRVTYHEQDFILDIHKRFSIPANYNTVVPVIVLYN